jgi:hypothetical protein
MYMSEKYKEMYCAYWQLMKLSERQRIPTVVFQLLQVEMEKEENAAE